MEKEEKGKTRQAKAKARQHRARQGKTRGAASGIPITPKTQAKARRGEATYGKARQGEGSHTKDQGQGRTNIWQGKTSVKRPTRSKTNNFTPRWISTPYLRPRVKKEQATHNSKAVRVRLRVICGGNGQTTLV